MDFRISVADSDIAFPCAAGETVLDAAERAGYAVPYSCRKGVCASCEGRLVAGEARAPVQGAGAGPAGPAVGGCLRPRPDPRDAAPRLQERRPPCASTLGSPLAR